MKRKFALFLMSSVAAQLIGASYEWVLPGDGTWSTDANWNPSSGFPNLTGDMATFPALSPSTIAVSGISSSYTVTDITFSGDATAYTLSGSGLTIGGTTPTIAQTGTQVHTIDVPLTLLADLIFDVGGTVYVSGGISGSYGIATSSGTGTTVLGGSNSFTGTIAVTNGTLQAGSTSAFPSASTNGVTVSGTLDLNGYDNTIYSLTGSGSVTASSSATLTIDSTSSFSGNMTDYLGVALGSGVSLTLNGSSNNYSGITLISSGATLTAGGVDYFSANSAIEVYGTLALQNFDNTIGGLSGSGAVTTTMSGVTLTISGSGGGGYSGSFPSLDSLVINGGTTQLGTTYDFGFPITVTSPGTLDLDGNDTTVYTISGTGTITASSSATLTVANSSVFAGSLTDDSGVLAVALGSGVTLELSGSDNNTYSGATSVPSGTTLQSDAAYSLPSQSPITVTSDGVIALQNYSNAIGSLYGNGTVTTSSSGVTLALNHGGSFSGTLPSNLAALDLEGGSFQWLTTNSFDYPFTGGGGGFEAGEDGMHDVAVTFTSEGTSYSDTSSTYSGDTIVDSGSSFIAGAIYTFSNNSAVDLYGTLQLNQYSNAIGGLNGTGSVEVDYSSPPAPTLTVYNGGSFSGTLPVADGAQLSSLDLQSGTLQFNGNTQTFPYSFTSVGSGSGGIQLSSGSNMTLQAANSYIGGTEIDEDSTLTILNLGNFSSQGDFIVNGLFYMNDTSLPDDLVVTVGPLSGQGNIYMASHTLGISPVNGDMNNNFSGSLVANTGSYMGFYASLIIDGDSNGVQILSGTTNNYLNSAIVASGVLQMGADNTLPAVTDVYIEDSGTFAVGAYSNTVYSVSGSGAITTGSSPTATLTITNGSSPHGGSSSFSGSISGMGSGGITLNDGTLLLNNGSSGQITYSGPTILNNSAILQAGGAENSLPLYSPITLNSMSILDISTNPSENTIFQLFGSASSTVPLGSGASLYVTGGGDYLGIISGSGSLYNSSGTLTLEGPNAFTGGTYVLDGTIALAGNGSLDLGGLVNVQYGTFDISGINSNSTNIGTLSDSGVGQGTINLGGKELRITPSESTSYSGVIQGMEGSLTLIGSGSGNNTLTLGGGANTYSGTTLVTGVAGGGTATLIIGADGALSSSTNVVVDTYGIFQLAAGTTNSAGNLTSSGIVNNYAGSETCTFTDITVSSGEFNNTGNSTLVFDTFTMTGGTVTNGSSSMTDTSQLGSPTASLDGSFTITNGIIDNYSAFNVTTYTQDENAVLNMYFSLVSPVNAAPVINCTASAAVAGTLNITYDGTLPGSFAGSYPIVKTVNGRTGAFEPANIINFSPFDPQLVYTYSGVYLDFPSTNATWGLSGSGSWDIGTADNVNWTPEGVPGLADGDTTFVNFTNYPEGSGGITVTLSDAAGTDPLQVTVEVMNFDSTNYSYTIEQYNSLSSITFAGETPLINVTAGSHTIDAPIIIDTVYNALDFVLTDGATLTLGSNTTITSANTGAGSNEMEVYHGSASAAGTGNLENYGNLTPNFLFQEGATITNYGTIDGGGFGIYPQGVDKAFFYNSGTNAILNSALTGGDGEMYIGYYGGTTTIVNNGVNAVFGTSANDQTMLVGSDGYGGAASITNSGYNAFFGPSGPGGYLHLYGNGTLSLINTGIGRVMGASGNGSIVEVSYGTVYNNLGAAFCAGPGGTLLINGGSVINDLRSVVGALNQNIELSSGLLSTSGSILAYDYTQSGTGVLQINLMKLPNLAGQINADAAANLGGDLIVRALWGCDFPMGSIVDLITAKWGVDGTFGSVGYTGFPDEINPSITYLQNEVVLNINPTVSPSTSSGSIPELSFLSANQNNFVLERFVTQLHSRVGYRPENRNPVAFDYREENLMVENEAAERKKTTVIYNEVLNRDLCRPWNFYIGPIDSVGNFNSQSSTQAGIDYNSIGALAGFDYAFANYGLGFSTAYANTAGRVDHGGHLLVNAAHGSLYGVWVPERLNQLGLSAIVGGGYEWISVDRKAGTEPALTAYGSPRGYEIDALVGAEYIFSASQFSAFPCNFQLIPLANLQYIYANIGSYNETGAGQFSLYVNGQAPSSLRSLIGTRLDHIYLSESVRVKSEFNIGWQYEYLDNSRALTFSTVNLASTKVVDTQAFGAHGSNLWIGFDFLVTYKEAFQFEASYDLQWNSFYLNNGFYLGLGGNF